MRSVTAILGLVVVALTTTGVVAQTKPSFAGEWKLVVANGQGVPGVDLAITQTGTAMTLEYRDAGKLTYKLEGSMWAGNTLVVTNTTGTGEEKRTLSMDAGYLVVETAASARGGGAPKVSKALYQPYVRGFGG